MRRFAQLFQALDASTATGDKVAALRALLRGRAGRRRGLGGVLPGRRQAAPGGAHGAAARRWPAAQAGIDDWLFDECYQAVGDLAETIAHVLPPADGAARRGPGRLGRAAPAAAARPAARRAGRRAGRMRGTSSTPPGRFLLVKLIGGGFRVGVSKLLVQRALAEAAGLDAKLVAQRLMGYTDARATPSAARYQRAASRSAGRGGDAGRPALPVLPGARAGPAPRRCDSAGPARRLAGGMEVRRHPRPARASAPGQVLDLVARRGTGDRALPRGGGAGAAPARRHRARRRDRWCGTRQAAPAPFSLLQQRIGRKTLSEEAAGRGAGGLRRLRPAGVRRAGPARRSRSTRAARCWKRCAGRQPACRCRRACRPPTGRPGRAARAVARARRRRLHAQAPRRRATAAAAPRPTAPGGSGRSTRSAWTPC